MECTILDIAVDHQISELQKVLKKAKYLGVDVTRATQTDVSVLEELKSKINGQDKLI